MAQKLNKKAERIIENIFDLVMKTDFQDQARKELDRDLKNHNVSIDKGKGLMTIEDKEGLKPLYEISITKL